MERLKDPDEAKANNIEKVIDNTIRSRHKVYLMTDWHLWKRVEKGKPKCNPRPGSDKILKTVNGTLRKDDLLIYLGDLVDGEFVDKASLKLLLKTIPGRKILVRGNNDLFDAAFYKSCGFDYVVDSFVWHDIIFSHVPLKHKHKMNIHGHLHGYRTYWVPYNNHIDVSAAPELDGRNKPVELKDVISAQKRYARTIKEQPEHFNEGYLFNVGDLFDVVMSNTVYIDDPFPDY